MVQNSTHTTDQPWWELFNDTTLTALISRALENNLGLQNALLRIRQSQLQYEEALTQVYPTVNYGVQGQASQYSLANSSFDRELNSVVQVSYTLDLWGKIKNQSEAALHAYLTTEYAALQMQVVLIAQVTQLYFTLRDLDNKILIAQEMVRSMQEFKDIIAARYNGGFISKVDLNQADIRLKETEVTLQTFLRVRTQVLGAINVTLGTTPEDIAQGLPLQDQLVVPQLARIAPAELLHRRPDLIAAEHELRREFATLGATQTLKYPNLNLSLDLGASLLKPTLLFSKLTAGLFGPLIQHGNINKTINIQEYHYKQAVNNYTLSYLNALVDVENALVAMQTYKAEFELRKQKMDLAQEAFDLAWIRYNEGVTSFLEFLDLQSSLFTAQLQASEAYKYQLESTVKLYLALGGAVNDEVQELQESFTD